MSMEERWSGRDALMSLNGDRPSTPPMRALFLAHRVGGSGTLRVVEGERRYALALLNGRLISCSGISDLLGARGQCGEGDLTTQLGQGIAAGVPPYEGLELAERAIGDALVAGLDQDVGQVEFSDELPPPEARTPLSSALPQLLVAALRRGRPAQEVRRALGRYRNASIRIAPPDDSPEPQWGLPTVALRLMRDGARTATLGELLGAARGGETDEAWMAVDLLHQFGILTIDFASAAPERAVEQGRAAPRADEQELWARLVEVRAHLKAQKPHEVLGLTTSNQLNEGGVNRGLRDISSQYHPDRFPGASPALTALVAECFGLVSDAHQQLMNADFRREWEERLKASETGQVYVADRDRQNGKLLLRKAEAAQKKGAWTEVAQLAADGLALDPTNWELEALSLQAGWRLGALPGLKAATRLAELGPKRGEIRANLLAEAGEILIKEGRPGEAMAQFQAAVAAFPEHIGARRRLRLHEQRTAPPPAPPPSALDSLKGLFRKGEAAPAPPVPPALPPKPR